MNSPAKIMVSLLGLLFLVAGGCAARPAITDLGAPLQFELNIPGRVAAPVGGRLRVGTYNLQGARKLQILQQDIARLPTIQLWAFQEVHVASTASDSSGDLAMRAAKKLEAILPPGTWHCAYVPLNLEDSGMIEGQAIASRFPFTSVEVWNLRHSGKKKRVALAATLTVRTEEILFVNTDHEVDWARLTGKDRQKQVESLTERLNTRATPRIILAGDFNATGDFGNFFDARGELRQLLQTMRAHHYLSVTPATAALVTFRSGFFHSQLDLVLIRGLTSPGWGTGSNSRGSDHYPLWAQIEFQALPAER